MAIEDYPRPPNDTGIGFHYCTGAPQFGYEALSFWLRELKELGASWLIVPCGFPSAVPDQFLAELVSNEIEPVIGLHLQPIAPMDAAVLGGLLRRYAGLGVHYVYLFRDANNLEMWEPAEWARPGLVGRFMEILWSGLERILEAGLWPVFTPPCPGGHYWDTTFLASCLDWINQRGKQHLCDRLAIGMQNYASNRPLSWGQGGRKRWPAARPYRCPLGCQDHRGFRMFEWYDEIVRARFGRSLPLIAIENGLVVGTRNSPEFPAVDQEMHARQVQDMTRLLMYNEVPDYVFNNAFWALEAGGGESFEGHAWYRRDGSRLPAVAALKAMPKRPRLRHRGNRSAEGSTAKAIAHYLLLPDAPSGRQLSRMEALLPLIAKHRLTVGFRPEEARQAQHVTLLATEDDISVAVEVELREAGCQVVRVLPGESPWSTERRLTEALEGKSLAALA